MPFLDFYFDNVISAIPKVLENTYLSNIEEKWGDTIYYFYQYCNTGAIHELAYIKDKGIVAGAYRYFFYSKGKRDILGGDWEKVIRDGKNHFLWAEELKKEWAEEEKKLENWKKG